MIIDRRGFLLLEVVVSLVIITAGLLFVARSYSSSKEAFQRSGEIFETSLLIEKSFWEYEERGEIVEGETSGDFKDKDGYSWQISAKRFEGSGLNIVESEVFKEKDPLRTKYSVSTYLKNKE